MFRRQKNRAYVIIFVAILLLAFLARNYFGPGPWNASTYIRGIDVARYQGEIDWPAVKTDGIVFAYMKATEGGDYTDPSFSLNWAGAQNAGVIVGGYHFFTLCAGGARQAGHFINVLGDQAGALPPAIDLEHMGPCREGPDVSDPLAEIRIMVDMLEREYGRRPVLYVTRQFHDRYLTKMTGETFWIRSIYRKPGFRKKEWQFWQYDHRGRVKGIDGPVDLNAYRYDMARLNAMRVD